MRKRGAYNQIKAKLSKSELRRIVCCADDTMRGAARLFTSAAVQLGLSTSAGTWWQRSSSFAEPYPSEEEKPSWRLCFHQSSWCPGTSETQASNNPQLAYLPEFQKAEYTRWQWKTPSTSTVMLANAYPVVHNLLTALVFIFFTGLSDRSAIVTSALKLQLKFCPFCGLLGLTTLPNAPERTTAENSNIAIPFCTSTCARKAELSKPCLQLEQDIATASQLSIENEKLKRYTSPERAGNPKPAREGTASAHVAILKLPCLKEEVALRKWSIPGGSVEKDELGTAGQDDCLLPGALLELREASHLSRKFAASKGGNKKVRIVSDRGTQDTSCCVQLAGVAPTLLWAATSGAFPCQQERGIYLAATHKGQRLLESTGYRRITWQTLSGGAKGPLQIH
ncbi:hypothetical protein Anapl_05866 [Anas platyrhynchos]|uniref:Uncharacterized protein n=1 Tax=Anas platyrhynchos TaxID=8839 RepID=R0M7C5_ANAPL|nr:hypothetical protein Anapl_05866 [Anas platyrhynchos]